MIFTGRGVCPRSDQHFACIRISGDFGLGILIVTFDLSDSECTGGAKCPPRPGVVASLRIGGDDRCHESHGNDQDQHRDGFDSIRCHLFSFCLSRATVKVADHSVHRGRSGLLWPTAPPFFNIESGLGLGRIPESPFINANGVP
jgi:hypothetical protein